MLALGLSAIALLFALNLLLGDVSIPVSDIFTLLSGGEVENNSWSYIIESRLNRSIVAIFSGAALALSGIILQVYFRNPLAGPGVLGITSGASLGVAFIMLGGVGVVSFFGQIGVIVAGILGAVSVLFLLLLVSKFIHNAVTLLVIGLMFGYFTSAVIDVLFLWADLDETRAFVIWGMGSFEGLQTADLLLMCGIILLAIVSSAFLIKPMNALVLGSEYASSLGINLKVTKYLVILHTGVMAAIVTVYCGPISFIGVAVPQLVRLIWSSKNHFIQIPATLILGAALALLADLIVRVSGNTLPLNTVTALIGAPIIIYTIIKLNKKIA
ncbi:MAG: iron ABC transporter permease [Crocinitomicaceae bacterium]|nr:iron ABC transporter permease [Crocinitomicaceae bacterium]